MKVLKKEEIFPTILTLFKKTQKYILISSPWIKLDVLKPLLEKDVDVQIILRNSELEDLFITDKKIFKYIKEKKGKLFLNPDIHAKFFVFDGKYAVLGSANLTDAGMFEDGNIETAVFIEDKNQIKKLENTFKQIKKTSLDLFSNIKGILLNSINSRTSEGLLFEKIPEQTYIKIPITKDAFYLGRISSVKDTNTSLFSTFFSFLSKSVFQETEKLKSIFYEKEEYWRKAAIFAYLNEKTKNISTCSIEILAEFNPEKIKEKESILKTPVIPPDSGAVFYTFEDEEEIVDLMKINHAGYKMGKPVPFGKLFNTNLNAFLDLEKIYTMHMAVLGTTGSGKTTFIKRVLENTQTRDIKFFIFDLYGEYYSSLKNTSVGVKEFSFENTVFPLSADQIKNLFKDYGVPIQEKSLEEKRIISHLRLSLKPDLSVICFREKNLEDILIEVSQLTDIDSPLRNEIFQVIDILKEDYGENALENQKKIVETVINSLNSKENIVIYDFKDIEDPITRINIAGLIMKEIFKAAKSKEGKRVVILEEAQNFVPEKGFGEVKSGSENLSYVMARKIATEGRKFNLGLVAITQRPANISKYVLSQLNTQVIFKLINKNDLDAVSSFFEFSKEDVFYLLPFLKPGSAYITGLAVPFGILTQIRLS